MTNSSKQMSRFSSLCTNAEEIIGNENLNADNIREFFKEKMEFLPSRFPYRLVDSGDVGMEGGKYVPIDEGICEAVLAFNREGYRTKYCCEGHPTKDRSCYKGYIYFTGLTYGRKRTLSEKFLMLSFGHARISFDQSFGDDTLIIRFSPFENNEEGHKSLMRAIASLAGSL